jgi:hypothetical protein
MPYEGLSNQKVWVDVSGGTAQRENEGERMREKE